MVALYTKLMIINFSLNYTTSNTNTNLYLHLLIDFFSLYLVLDQWELISSLFLRQEFILLKKISILGINGSGFINLSKFTYSFILI